MSFFRPRWVILELIVSFLMSFFLTPFLFDFFKNLLPTSIEFVALNLFDGFLLLTYVWIILGFIFFSLFFLINSIIYFYDAFYEKEKKMILKLLLPGVVLFILGFIFGVWLYSKIMINFFVGVNFSLGLVSLLSLFDVMSAMLLIGFLLGFVFEFPLVLRFFIKIGLIETSFLKQNRYFVFIGLYIISAIITPTPDILTSLIVCIPLYGLFELALIGL